MVDGPVSDGRADRIGEIIAVGSRPAGMGQVVLETAAKPGEPTLRWRSRAHSIPEIEEELGRIWAVPNLDLEVDGAPHRHVAARTSVMNLVVIARRPELAERCAATIQQLTGRHPSRTLVIVPADPDGPSWIDAQVEAHCILPREDAPETCAETIYLTAGGETGRHLDALVAPLVVHDLPVITWWPGQPPFGREQAEDVFALTDRLVVDGSTWNGDGLDRLRLFGNLGSRPNIALFDFAIARQARWREAIASTFDHPEFRPFVWALRRIAVTYGTHDPTGALGSTNIVKPVYHVAWLASRLGLELDAPLAPVQTTAARPRQGEPEPMHRGLAARLRNGRSKVAVVVRPVLSDTPPGTTLRVELLAERRGSELRIDVTAEAESVVVHAWQDGVETLARRFHAVRRTDVDLLAEAIETTVPDGVSGEAIAFAAQLAGGSPEAEPIDQPERMPA